MGRVAEQHPGLAARRVIVHAHVVQRHLVAMVNLIDAFGLDANAGRARSRRNPSEWRSSNNSRANPLASRRPASEGRWLGELDIQVMITRAATASTVKTRKNISRLPARARKMASHSSRTAPEPPGERATQCAADKTTGWASATAAASPTADINGRSGVSSTMQAQFNGSTLRRFVSVCECQQFIPAALDHGGHLQFAQARGRRRGAPAAESRHLHAGGHEQLDAVAVADVKYLECFSLGAEVQPAVGQHAIDVQDQKLDLRRAAWRCGLSKYARAQQIVHVERADHLALDRRARSAR